MCLNKKSGFTLIELMVVIVIIGVLASLAIPRFTEASAKAKAAEAPRVIASFESAFLAAVAEHGWSSSDGGGLPADVKDADLMFDVPTTSKWFKYTNATEAGTLKKGNLGAKSRTKLGDWDGVMGTNVNDKGSGFIKCASDLDPLKKLVPNFAALVGVDEEEVEGGDVVATPTACKENPTL